MSKQHTPFARWLLREKRTAASIARKLGVSRQRVTHWRNGRSEPQPLRVLVKLLEITGLKAADFIVSEKTKAARVPAMKLEGHNG